MCGKKGHRFSRNARLCGHEQFRHVFASSFRTSDRLFVVLARMNDVGNSRLGLAIAKKHVRQAHQRNRVKRVVRESFRLSQHLLVGLDLVVLSRSGIAIENNARLRASLNRHWRQLLCRTLK